ncbi:MAG: GIY-YIG nuclease family protein [Gemmatimonadales bacterium]
MPGRRYYFVYILANQSRDVIYTGVTRDLVRRVAQHRGGSGGHFTRRYWVRQLVWYEIHGSPASAITREKQIKAGSRLKKVALIEARNPNWRDLWDEI